MSRGHGERQRRILALFAEKPEWMPDSIEIGAAIAGDCEISAAESTSTRRALRRLASEGLLVDMGRGFRFGRRRWALPNCAETYTERVRAAFGDVRDSQ